MILLVGNAQFYEILMRHGITRRLSSGSCEALAKPILSSSLFHPQCTCMFTLVRPNYPAGLTHRESEEKNKQKDHKKNTDRELDFVAVLFSRHTTVKGMQCPIVVQCDLPNSSHAADLDVSQDVSPTDKN